MDATTRTITALTILLAAVALIAGCEGNTTTEAPAGASTKAPAAAAMVVVEEGDQTNCPVMGGKIVKDHYADYKGQRVYFCCPSCDATFKQDPEKYIAQLKEKGVTLAKVGPASR